MEIILVILIILIILLCVWLGWKLRLFWQNLKFKRSRKKGSKGEMEAIKLLDKAGYKVLSSQVPFSGHVFVDSEPIDFDVRVDFLVERDGLQYLAEVKTGTSASPSYRDTRRQLLEYATLGSAKRIILVDATKSRVMKIEFQR